MLRKLLCALALLWGTGHVDPFLSKPGYDES
jgi:hypothetical protein